MIRFIVQKKFTKLSNSSEKVNWILFNLENIFKKTIIFLKILEFKSLCKFLFKLTSFKECINKSRFTKFLNNSDKGLKKID